MQNPSVPKKFYSRWWRFRKAYRMAIGVALSYYWLMQKRRVFGKSYYDRKLPKLHAKNANRIKKNVLELQGLFIKAGQLLSILTNVFPEEFHAPLESLQDQLPPRPYEEVKRRIEKELQQLIATIFKKINKKPVAAASIGQAHYAELHDGTPVIVKVQHANIEAVAAIDLQIIERLVRLFSRFYKVKGFEYLYTEVRKMIEEELDFEREAQNMEAISQNLKEEVGIAVPEVYHDLSTKRVLVSRFYNGVKINNIQQLTAWQIDQKLIAERLLRAFCKMLFIDGLYHADPHPGNILVQEDGTIVLLDFGAVAVLPPKVRQELPRFLEATVKGDVETIVEILSILGFVATNKEAEEVAEKFVNALQDFLKYEVELEGMNINAFEIDPFNNQMMQFVQTIGLKSLSDSLQVPKEYVLLNRMIPLLLGICNTLAPKLNPLDVVRPYAQEYLLGSDKNWLQFARQFLQQTVTDTLAIPDELRKVLKMVRKGKTEIHISGIKESANLLYMLGHQLIYTFLAITAATAGYFLFQSNHLENAKIGFGVGIFFLLLLFRSMWNARKVRRRM